MRDGVFGGTKGELPACLCMCVHATDCALRLTQDLTTENGTHVCGASFLFFLDFNSFEWNDQSERLFLLIIKSPGMLVTNQHSNKPKQRTTLGGFVLSLMSLV